MDKIKLIYQIVPLIWLKLWAAKDNWVYSGVCISVLLTGYGGVDESSNENIHFLKDYEFQAENFLFLLKSH